MLADALLGRPRQPQDNHLTVVGADTVSELSGTGSAQSGALEHDEGRIPQRDCFCGGIPRENTRDSEAARSTSRKGL